MDLSEYADRLWNKVDKKGPDDCWNWLGAAASDNPVLTINRKTISGRRMLWELTHGEPPPKGRMIRMSCGNKLCLNPAHLWLVTPENILERNVKRGAPEECWEWSRGATTAGYGAIQSKSKGKIVLAHRLTWEQVNGPIPEGMHVCHKCDNPLCCNPSHLFLGTPEDNIRDAAKKGRMPRGENHTFSKLTESDIEKIRLLAKTSITRKEIAERFNVSRGAIADILFGRTWKHVSTDISVPVHDHGVLHPQAKLTPESVREIRALSEAGKSQRKLAAMFSVSRGTIEAIIKGETWKHVD